MIDTEAVFGTYDRVYDMIAAQEDEAVVPVELRKPHHRAALQ